MKKVIITGLIMGLLLPLVVNAATYYVAKTGNDSNSCSQAQSQSTPRRTINAGIGCMAGGDTLIVMAGTYAENITQSGIPAGSSWAAPTIIKRNGTDTVVFQATNNNAFYASSESFIVVDGIIYEGGVTVGNGAHHIRFINCTARNSSGQGIHLAEGDGNEVINCDVYNNGTDISLDHGIYIKTGNNIIKGNRVYSNRAAGIQFYNAGNARSGNVMDGNTIYSNGWAGSFAHDATGIIVSNNVIYWNNLTQGDVALSLKNSSNAKVFNNTITGNGSPCMDLSNSSGIVVRNNICWNNGGLINDSTGATKTNNLTNDPKFVNSSAGDFRLQSTSPAINAGVTISEITVDFNGISRPQGGAYDIGAYEFSSSTNLAAPSSLIVSP